ncbi:type II secretion system F family protein [Prochlorococcus sp. MIT 1303]|uniref:type II secretion system F family protein n=1 Tax=Prochlorococcus sp. MIT 1303 TaxID=1723647 RepID=UPI0007B3B30F|nr:type II secretion system F family protein [Prochlorococcus sp. MIT 1303]
MAAATIPQISPKRLKIPQKDLLVFFRQLAVVLQSGVSLAQGLLLIGENMTNKKFRACIYAIAARLNAGEDLSFCLKQYPKVFAPITVGLIEAGEVGGILDQVLERIALLLEEQAKLKGQIIGALIYPAIVLLLAVTVSLGLLIGIVPKFEMMFSNMGSELPALTKFMLNLSRFVTTPGFAIGAPVTIFVCIFLFRGFYASKEGRIAVDTGIFAIPLFGDLILRSEMAALCDTLSTLVTSGIPLVDSLQRCMTASSNQLIKNTIQLGIQLVREGQELNYAFNQSKIMPRLVVSMIKIGEETGELSFMLEKLSDFYKREVESTVSALTKAMEPAIIFVVAGIVGTIVIALYLPMFSMIKAMKG